MAATEPYEGSSNTQRIRGPGRRGFGEPNDRRQNGRSGRSKRPRPREWPGSHHGGRGLRGARSEHTFEIEHFLDVRHQNQLDAAIVFASSVALVCGDGISLTITRSVELLRI